MAIGDDFTIDYVNQRIYHSSGTTVYTLNQLYTYTTVTFDDDVQMDDLPPMSAQTPTAFTMENSWFIDPVSLQFLNGGSLTTLGWNSSATYPNGIRVITFGGTYTDAVPTDIGKPVAYTAAPPADTGTLLYYDNALRKWWVRTDDQGDTFADFSEAISVTGGTGTGIAAAASTTGENTWANVFTLGTVAPNTQIFLYQSDAQITPWWSTGHIDVLILVKESGAEIDYGNVTIFARQYTKLYDHYVADLTSGARTPIPLATFDDSNNLSGYRQFTYTPGVGTFAVGDVIFKTTDSTVSGIVTAVGTGPDTITYYLYKYPLTDFSAADDIQTTGGVKTGTNIGAPSNVGPANLGTPPVITFNGVTRDLNNGAGLQPYDVVIDCNQNSLANVYQYLKYITRYGNTSDIDDRAEVTITGESYDAIGEVRLRFHTQATAFVLGETITGGTSAASGVVVSILDEGTTGAVILRNVVGTFGLNEAIMSGATTRATTHASEAASTISPSKQSPFGTFAGGKFFGARGVWITNYQNTESNNFQLIDSTNTARIPPLGITLTVNGILADDQVAVFRATGDNNIVDRAMYHISEAHLAGVDYIRVTEPIPNDTPQTGYIRVVRRNASGTILGEEKYQYDGFSGSEFSLDPTPDVGISATTTQNYDTDDTAYVPYIDATAADTNISVGLIYVSTRYITCRVRKTGILPFMIKSSISNSNLTITAVRATDSIAPLGT